MWILVQLTSSHNLEANVTILITTVGQSKQKWFYCKYYLPSQLQKLDNFFPIVQCCIDRRHTTCHISHNFCFLYVVQFWASVLALWVFSSQMIFTTCPTFIWTLPITLTSFLRWRSLPLVLSVHWISWVVGELYDSLFIFCLFPLNFAFLFHFQSHLNSGMHLNWV